MPHAPRIVSLLPAATEMACVLGLEAQIVGVSDGCNYPLPMTRKPRVVAPALDMRTLTPIEIDHAVRARVQQGHDLHLIDEQKLAALKPDVILAQDLCQVCAPSGSELAEVLDRQHIDAKVVLMSPHTLDDILQNLKDLAAITGMRKHAAELTVRWQQRRDAVHKSTLLRVRRPRVFVMEWVDPIYCAGHWLAEMIQIAGGEDIFARPGQDSVQVEWQQVVNWQPEVLVIAPCGYNQKQAEEQLTLLKQRPGLESLPAVKNGRIYPVDADGIFVRPGPRVFDGLEILADLFRIA